MNIQSVCPQRSILGEGPFWDTQRNCIGWIDILAPCIHIWDEKSSHYRNWTMPSMIGCAALDEHGDFIVALEDGFWKCKREDGSLKLLAPIEAELKANRFNDGKCDPSGRFWAGSLSLNEIDPTGSVYCMDANQQIKTKISDVTISNGLSWSLDKKHFYYIDTPTLAVARFDFENATGNISNKKIIIKISQHQGFPDGMTIDTEGMIWIAHWGGWQITRWNPETGEQLDAIALPASQVTSLCFGGEQLDEIYVTTASRGLTEHQLAEEPLAGQLFVIRDSGYRGLPFHNYNSKQHD